MMWFFLNTKSEAFFNVFIVKEQKRSMYFSDKFRNLGGVWLCWLSGAHVLLHEF